MAHGYPDYYFWAYPIGVPQGGTGDTTLTLNGVLIGQAQNGIWVTAAGAANQVLRVPAGGGAPVFSSLGALADLATLDLSSAYAISILPIAKGGTGTNSPALVAGSGITISGSWPAQTITNTSQASALGDPVAIAHGGTGTATPALVAGTGITISGSWPAQTITNTSAYATLGDPLPVAHGGTGTTTPALVAGTGISISGSWPAQTITNTSAYATLGDPLPVAHGGTGTTTPALVAGTGISISGTWPSQTITNTSAYATLGDPLPVAHGGTGTTTPALVAGTGISISGTWPAQTITNTSPVSALGDPVAIAHGGTGTTTPALVAGTGISISGTWPAQTITNTSAYATLADPLAVGHGGTGTATPALGAGAGISITGSWPGQTITNTSPASALGDPVAIVHGGTGTATPALVAGTAISISGSWPAQTITNTSAYATLADPLPVAHGGTGTGTPAMAFGSCIDFSGSSSIVNGPPAGSGNVGWKFTLFTNNYAVGLASCTLVVSTAYWFSLFDCSIPPANDGTGTVPDSKAKVTLGIDGSIRAGSLFLTTALAITSGGTGAGACSAGQLLIGSGANTAAWGTPDGCRVYNNAAESVGTGTYVVLTFNSERYDKGGMHSTVTNTSRITAQKAGVYSITGHVVFDSNATGYREVGLYLNGTTYIADVEVPAASGDVTALSVSTLFHLAVNDYVELRVRQTSGSTLNVQAVADYSPEFAAQWLGP